MPTISVITPTFNREEALQRCVASVLRQHVDAEIQHIIVNDYGKPLDLALWMDDPRVTVLNTFRTERAVARNTGAALSRGDWLYFLDDDDYALPGAFAAMLEVAERTRAAHIYGGYTLTAESHGETQALTPNLPPDIFALLVAGETLPPQGTWLRRDAFFAVGGFDALMVPVEDVDLFRRVALWGQAAGTHALVAHVRVDHPNTSTTREDVKTRKWAESLEQCLSEPEALKRVLEQTAGEPYWRGRCTRVYYGSALRNARQRRFGLAWGRLTAALRLSRSSKSERGSFRRGFLRKARG